jgi:hypothetical protein
MLVYSSKIIFTKKVKLFLFLPYFLLFFINGCDEDVPIPPGETFDIAITSPQDSSFVLQSLQVELSISSDNKSKHVNFYIDNFPVASDSVGNNLFLVDVSGFSDDNFHQVRAVVISESGASGYSKPLSLKIFKLAKYNINLISPADQFVERSNNKVELRWLPSAVIKKTIVEISRNYFFNEILFSDTAPGRSLMSPDLQAGDYYWRLKAEFKDTSLTMFSLFRNFKIAGPVPPTLISPANNEITHGSGDLTFTWIKSSGAVQYDFLLLDDDTKDTVLYTIMNNDSLFTTLLPLGAYSWKMRAKNIGGIWGEWSNQLRFGHGVFYKIVDAGAMLMPIQIKKHTDDNFLILGNAMPFEPYSYLTKISPDGLTIWSKRFDGVVIKSFDVLSDGSIILAAEQTEIMPVYIHYSKIIKLDYSGNTVWENMLSNNNEFLSDIRSVTDGYILVGSRIDSLSNKSIPIMIKVSPAGDLIYRKLFGVDEPSKTKVFADNLSIITFGYSLDQNNLLTFGKYDLLANELVKRNYNGWLGLRGAKRLSDEYFLVGGSVNSGQGMFVKKITSTGDILMESEFNLSFVSSIIDVSGSLTGNYFVTGYNKSASQENRIYFGKIDANGTVLKEKQYPGESGYSLVSTDDGGVLILGYINNGVMCIIKTNSNGTTFYGQ